MPKLRPKENRKPKRKLYIYCEGEKTEPNYINGYIKKINDGALRDVVKIQPTRKNTPTQLVDEAVSHKKAGSSIAGDVFWVVFDRESVTKYADSLHDKAFQKAKANDINIALSNVCFEHWLLLHFQESSAPYGCFDDFIRRSPFRQEFKRVSGKSYEKNELNVFSVLCDFVGDARARAARINARALSAAQGARNKPHHLNPYTDMPKLLDAIDAFV